MAKAENITVEQTLSFVLDELEIPSEDRDGRTMSQLARIEAAITAGIEEREELRRRLNALNFSISEISNRSGLSRATFYNKPLLSKYVEHRRNQELHDADAEKLEAAKDRIAQLEDKVEKLLRRDGELVLAKMENDRLKKRVAALEGYFDSIPPDIQEELTASGRIIPMR